MMKVKIILNPYANRWRAQKQVPAIRAAFDAVDVAYDLVITTQPREATKLAIEAATQDYDAVIAAGGDGTLFEVVNGLIEVAGNRPTMPFFAIPIGTGNDFCDMVGIPRDVEQVANIVAAGNTRQIDLGQINDSYFQNNCAAAMEPMVTLENIAMKRLSGTPRYVVALIKVLFKLQAWHMQIEWDDGSYEGPTYLLSVCNGPRTGSTFMMAPDAKFDDGLFDVVLIPKIKMRTVLRLLPKLFTGKHVADPLVSYFRTSELKITSTPGTPIHADGEMVADSAETIHYQIHAGKLTLLC